MNATASTSAMPANSEEDVFLHVTERLIRIGAVPVPLYLQEPALAALSRNAFAAPPNQLNTAPAPAAEPTITRAVARLHQACQHTFGSTEALRYEFEEDAATFGECHTCDGCFRASRCLGKRCKLTITRPNGTSRVYHSPTAHQRKYDAKAHVSTVALENGAIDFIISGEGTGTPEAEQPPPPPQPEVESVAEMDESVKSIEQTCLSRTSGRIKPFWLLISEPKFGRSTYTLVCAHTPTILTLRCDVQHRVALCVYGLAPATQGYIPSIRFTTAPRRRRRRARKLLSLTASWTTSRRGHPLVQTWSSTSQARNSPTPP